MFLFPAARRGAAGFDAFTQARTTVKNSQGQVTQVTDAQGNTITYSYDPFGNLLSTNAGGVTTAMEYDLRGRKVSMRDPDMVNWADTNNKWTYAYDALGQLKRQTDAKGQVSTMIYDKLGRMTKRTEPDLMNDWYYDAYKGGGTCTKGIGKLCEVDSPAGSGGNGYNRKYTYDVQGRVSQIATVIDSTYTVNYGYDANGRLAQTTYPTGFIAKNFYNARGYLTSVTNNTADVTFWRADAMSASGRVLTETVGISATYGGTATTRGYDVLDRMTSNAVGAIQNFTYTYDTIGNLKQRVDAFQNPDLTENFSYDRLNRLLQSSGAGLTTKTYTYTATGNIATAPGTTYNYNAQATPCTSGQGGGPHAVCSVTGAVNGFTNPAFAYDKNGNMTSGLGRTLTYTSYNMPATVIGVGYSGGISYTYAYTYNADHERTKLVHSTLGTFIYLHPAGKGQLLYEKEVKPSALTEHKHYITAGAINVGVYISRSDSTTATRYFHHDHLGSLTLITNEAGGEVERLAYDAFGKRRYPAGTDDPNNGLFGINTDRGFTSHEHLDEVALIHMNGRIYDPNLRRFITADPFIDGAANLQAYNRYSYVNNNPLAYYDPSGYFKLKSIFKVAVVVAASIVTAGWASAAYLATTTMCTAYTMTTAAIIGGMAGGFTGGLIASGGNFDAGLRGAVTGGLFGAVSGIGAETSLERIAAHAAVGCASSAAGGGSCASGALSAGAAKFATGQLNGVEHLNDIGRGVAVAVVGGTASVIGGGKFENGATTAAFGYLFNHCSSVPGGCLSAFKDAASMARDWALGVGPDTRVFGPGSIQVTDMMDAPGVNAARDLFYQKNAGGTLDPVTNYAARFGVIDYLTTTSPTQQFVGRYRVDVFAVDQGKSLMFVLNNTSSFKSFAYGAPPAPAYERSTFGPAGNMRQTYWWTEPRR